MAARQISDSCCIGFRSMTRESVIARFLGGAGWQDAKIRPLAGDASLRSYRRLTKPGNGSTAILMDAPTETCGALTPFINSTEFLEGAGFSVPEILAADEGSGLLLLEDLGDDLVSSVVAARPELESGIYRLAIDTLSELQGHDPGTCFPDHSVEEQTELSALALEWYGYCANGKEPSSESVEELRQILRGLLSSLSPGSVFVHRDYHAENLFWLPNRVGTRQIGLIDHQDGSVGHPAYDLASILEDARRDISDELREELIQRYTDSAGSSQSELSREIAICGAQRNLRILGVFARLALRDRKTWYLDFMPRVWRHLSRDLAHSDLRELSGFVGRNLPAPEPALLDRIRRQSG